MCKKLLVKLINYKKINKIKNKSRSLIKNKSRSLIKNKSRSLIKMMINLTKKESVI